jgi:hypothetical protein
MVQDDVHPFLCPVIVCREPPVAIKARGVPFDPLPDPFDLPPILLVGGS